MAAEVRGVFHVQKLPQVHGVRYRSERIQRHTILLSICNPISQSLRCGEQIISFQHACKERASVLVIITADTIPQRLERQPNKKTAGLTDSPFVDSRG